MIQKLEMPPDRKRRAAAVCRNCHRRKIKCDLHSTGSPCTKCSENGETCEARTRKSYAPRKKRAPPVKHDDEDELQTEAASLSQSIDYSDSASDNEDAPDQVIGSVVPPNEVVNAETAPLFIGDQQGIGALLNVTRPPTSKQKQQHFMIPRLASKVLAREDLEYLKAKGCFSLPAPEICTALVEAYFNFVHPLFPIIDAQEFLGRYAKNGVQQINLLLLWSMFSVSASYISEPLLKEVGYKTRKGFKEDLIKQAKLLFDLSCENDKIILIQSSLLLSFWFQDAEDMKQSWYWTGIAISIAQTIGLHRNPDVKGKRKNAAISERQRRLWRNIWWSCYLRDAWLAFGMGRPMRINAADCNCPMPTFEDSEASFKDVVVNGMELYASGLNDFANLWLELLGISKGLHRVLCLRYRGTTYPSQIETMKSEITPLFSVLSTPTSTTPNNALTVTRRHVNLHRLAAQIALFRPDTDTSSITKVQDAANSINNILEKSMADGTAIYSAPTIVPLIVPAMYTHLMMARSKDEMKRRLGNHKLDFGLLFLGTLEGNYPAAGIVGRLFAAALAVGKERKADAEGVAQDDRQQPMDENSSGTLGVTNFDAISEGSSFGYSPSGFALLPTQETLFDVGMDENDRNLLLMNFELDSTQNFYESELSNDFSDLMDSYKSMPLN
ncbi:hypothetical protein N431DRAFT_446867 [Stipitochalara longipes BDJ]|nr:hypothetical protein N431DRAFT_446867 [Stipitochalara longipes BDJ]